MSGMNLVILLLLLCRKHFWCATKILHITLQNSLHSLY